MNGITDYLPGVFPDQDSIYAYPDNPAICPRCSKHIDLDVDAATCDADAVWWHEECFDEHEREEANAPDRD